MDDKLLTADERQEFRELEQTFGTPGWRRVRDIIQKEIDDSPAYYFANAGSWEELLAARSRVRVLLELINYESLTETRKEQLITARSADAENEEEDLALENL